MLYWGLRRNSSLLFQRGPDLSIYPFPSALLRPYQCTSFVKVCRLVSAFPGLFTYSEVLDFGPRFWTSATPTTFPTSTLDPRLSRKPVSCRRRHQYPSSASVPVVGISTRRWHFRSEPLFPERNPYSRSEPLFPGEPLLQLTTYTI